MKNQLNAFRLVDKIEFVKVGERLHFSIRQNFERQCASLIEYYIIHYQILTQFGCTKYKKIQFMYLKY